MLHPYQPASPNRILLRHNRLETKRHQLHLQLWAGPQAFDRDRLSHSSNMAATDLQSPPIRNRSVTSW
jgi:hypothetical protein